MLPIAGFASEGGGMSIENLYLRLPSVSNTWTRRLARSPAYMLSLLSGAVVCSGPGMEVLAALADEAAVAVEFENLRGRGAERVGDGAAARIDVDVALGVHRHARGFAQVHVRRQLDEIRHRVERKLGRRGRL